jgi:type VI secretion system secreted protein Hcp
MAVDMFLKLTDLKGEAQDKSHKEEIDVLAWSWGMSQSGTMHTGGGGGGGKVAIQDISVTKWVDKASPILMKYCSSGKQFKEGVLTVRKAGGDNPLEYIIITMSDVIVTSLSTGGSGGEDRLTENCSLNFAAVKVEYQPQKPDGSADGGKVPWEMDIAANEQK